MFKILAVAMDKESIRAQISQVKAKINKLSKDRKQLEDMILCLGPMLEGSFTKRYTRCKKPGCKCEKGQRHGPYFSISKKDDNGKTRLEYVRSGQIVVVSQLLEARRQFRAGLKRLKQTQQAIDEALFQFEQLKIREGEAQRTDLRKS